MMHANYDDAAVTNATAWVADTLVFRFSAVTRRLLRAAGDDWG